MIKLYAANGELIEKDISSLSGFSTETGGVVFGDGTFKAFPAPLRLEIEYPIVTRSEDGQLMSYFKFSHLPEFLQSISKPFADLALSIYATVIASPERTNTLRKLLEAKDSAVRARLDSTPVKFGPKDD